MTWDCPACEAQIVIPVTAHRAATDRTGTDPVAIVVLKVTQVLHRCPTPQEDPKP